VDPARARALGGTGLGLAIVKHIALAHRGSVTVESAPGRGSVFTIRLPRKI
jgi:two-component system phosphate regulon sensor histidine kinase PhoR